MTVSTTQRRHIFAGDGITRRFPLAFPFLRPDDLGVWMSGAPLPRTAWNVETRGAAADVVLAVAPPPGAVVAIERHTPRTQETRFVENDPFPASAHERALDRLTMIAQETADELDRTLKLPPGDASAALNLPPQAMRADRLMGFDATGRPVAIAAGPVVGPADAAGTSYQHSGPGVVRTVAARLRDQVSALDFGVRSDGVTNDGPALQAAIDEVAAGGGGTLSLPPGVMLAGGVRLRSNVRLLGAGQGRTIVRAPPGATALGQPILEVSQSQTTAQPENNVRDIELAHFTIEHRVAHDGFAEHVHCLRLSGVSHVHLHHLDLVGFPGDGIYLGSGETGGTERHNEHVIIEHCRFDGLNNDNRNGISVIDGSWIVIRDNSFRRVSRPTMPGPIDVEPDDYAFMRVRSIHVVRNRFRECGGNLAKIAVYLPRGQDQMMTAAVDFIIADNFIEQSHPGVPRHLDVGVAFVQRENKRVGGRENGVRITGNTVLGGGRGVLIIGARDVTVAANTFRSQDESSLIGLPGPLDACFDVTVERNSFDQVGQTNGYALQLVNSELVDVVQNSFQDVGRADGTLGVAVQSPDGRRLRLIDNLFESRIANPPRTTHWVTTDSPDPLRCVARGNVTSHAAGGPPAWYMRAAQTDRLDTGGGAPAFTTATPPDSFALGESLARASGTLPAGATDGLLRTRRHFQGGGALRVLVEQTLAGTDGRLWRRTGLATSNGWGPWLEATSASGEGA